MRHCNVNWYNINCLKYLEISCMQLCKCDVIAFMLECGVHDKLHISSADCQVFTPNNAPGPGIEPRPAARQADVLTTRPPYANFAYGASLM